MNEQEPLTVTAPVGSRLEQLQASYAEAKAQADEAAARLKVVTDGIKAELSAAIAETGDRRVDLVGGPGPALTMTYAESWRVDAKKLKAEAPETYVRFAKKSSSWTLRLAKTAGGAE